MMSNQYSSQNFPELWTIRYKPLPGELLSSWLVRLAHGHGLKIQTFSRMLFGNRLQVWNRDIDRFGPAWMLGTLSTGTGTTMQAVKMATLSQFNGLLFRGPEKARFLPWILPVVIHHRLRLGHGQQYCPICLKTDKVPYFRTSWRTSLQTFCPKHDCLLMAHCPECNSSVAFHRVDTGVKDRLPSITTCYHCGTDLAEAPASEPLRIDEGAYSWLRSACQSVENYACGQPPEIDVEHMALARHCSYLLLSNSPRAHLGAYVTHEMRMPKFSPMVRSIDDLPTAERHLHLLQVGWLMADWETRLKMAWRDRAICYSHLRMGFKDIPDWFNEFADAIPHHLRGGARAVVFS